MIHYHGSPITPEVDAALIVSGRHAMVSYADSRQLEVVADVCQSFALDNGAFSAWRAGRAINDWEPYFEWLDSWRLHPGFDFALIPDVIDGSEEENDLLVAQTYFRYGARAFEWAVPIWHLHESLDRLHSLSTRAPRVALGSSGEYAQIGTRRWWRRMAEVFEELCVDGLPRCKIHGLRMLDPEVFTRFPFSSADSTNVARNIGIDSAWRGTYLPAGKAARGIVIAQRIESQQSAPRWERVLGSTTLSLFDGVLA